MLRDRATRHEEPLVVDERLPTHERETAAVSRSAPDIRKGRDWIGEEHDPEPGDHSVEQLVAELVYLSVGLHESGVRLASCTRVGARAFQHRLRQVNTNRFTC